MKTTNDLYIAATEVCTVLKNIPKDKYYKIPKKITSLLEKYNNYNFVPKIDLKKDILEQEISQKAKDILFAISINYWLNEEERKKVIETMNLNEKKNNQKYDINKMFQSKKENDKEVTNNVQSIANIKKETWIKKLFKFIKKKIFFR